MAGRLENGTKVMISPGACKAIARGPAVGGRGGPDPCQEGGRGSCRQEILPLRQARNAGKSLVLPTTGRQKRVNPRDMILPSATYPHHPQTWLPNALLHPSITRVALVPERILC